MPATSYEHTHNRPANVLMLFRLLSGSWAILRVVQAKRFSRKSGARKSTWFSNTRHSLVHNVNVKKDFFPLNANSTIQIAIDPGVRKTPSWPRSWANFCLLSLYSAYSHRNAWANLHLLGQPNTFLARDEGRSFQAPVVQAAASTADNSRRWGGR
jgi:hypothetical protein